MPGGELIGFEAREASSPFYLLGSFLSVINPIMDTAAGIRDLAANLEKGDLLGAAIEAVGLLPGGDLADDVGDLVSITKTWVKHYPQKAGKALKPLSNMILEKLPKEADSAKKKIMDVFPDAAKQEAGPKALPPGEKVKALPPGIQDLTKRNDIVGYTPERMDRLRKSEEFTNTDLNRLADSGADLRMVEGLSKNGVSKAKIKELSESDANLEAANRLSSRGFSGDHLVHIAKRGEDALPKLTLDKAEKLKNEGYDADDIVYISKNAEKKYPVRGKLSKKPLRKGVTTEQFLELRKQEVPAEDVRYYVENSYSLKLVNFLRKQDHSPSRIRSLLGGSPEEVKMLVKRGRKTRDRGSTLLAAGKDTYT